eukprot:scaffold6107_cov130-Isochrysis_galbana.AAC.11
MQTTTHSPPRPRSVDSSRSMTPIKSCGGQSLRLPSHLCPLEATRPPWLHAICPEALPAKVADVALHRRKPHPGARDGARGRRLSWRGATDTQPRPPTRSKDSAAPRPRVTQSAAMQRGSRLAPGHCLPIPSSNCSAHRLAGPLEPCARGRSPRYAVPRHRNRPDLLGRGGSRNRLLIAQRVDAGHARAGKGAVACGRGLGWVDDGVPLRIVEPPVLLNGKRVEEVGQFVFEGHEGRPQRRHIPAAREERAQCRRRAVGQRRTQALQPSAHGGLQRRPIGIRDLRRGERMAVCVLLGGARGTG